MIMAVRSMQIFCFWVSLKIFFACAQEHLIVSIDCGSNATYHDSLGIKWESDASYINSGKIATVNAAGSDGVLPRRFTTLRYFSSGLKKNCYPLPVLNRGMKYLLRASFYYGNYDGKASPPSFVLQFDGNHWDNVVTYLDKEATYELTYVVKAKSTGVCVARTSADHIPFLSSIEVRAMELTMYPFTNSEDVLVTYARVAFGSPAMVRYPDDPYDRIWCPNPPISGLESVTSESKTLTANLPDMPPTKALLHAVTPSSPNATFLTIPGTKSATTLNLRYAFYFSEVSQRVAQRKSRAFRLSFEGLKDLDVPPETPPFGQVDELPNVGAIFYDDSVLMLVNEVNATVPPIINALEFFLNRHGLAAGTLANDVEGLKLLKDNYKQLQYWAGDPCLPVGFTWEWLSCDNGAEPQVNELTLDGLELTGSLPDFSILSALEKIDLSNNSLTGEIPRFLGELPRLKELNLAFNDFTGYIPSTLLERKDLKLNVSGNRGLIIMGKKENAGHNNLYKIVGTSVGAFVFLTITVGVLLYVCHRKEPGYNVAVGLLQSETNRAFSYQEIVEITNNFEKFMGKEGSVSVYYGRLKNQNGVSVKVLPQRNLEFAERVKLQMTVHHKNLVALKGICEENGNMILLYEYITNGTLEDLLMGMPSNVAVKKNVSDILTWKKRLNIARDVATGLQYLHSECHPAIIHANIRPRNILLNEQLEAKIAEFAVFTNRNALPELDPDSTEKEVAAEYRDPEYALTGIFTEKSDVYSFGVVLLELMCGKLAILVLSENCSSIVEWATTEFVTGGVESIADTRLDVANIDSMWKVADLAMACTRKSCIGRPSMDEALNQLDEAIEMEIHAV